jgi:hypothetical protein
MAGFVFNIGSQQFQDGTTDWSGSPTNIFARLVLTASGAPISEGTVDIRLFPTRAEAEASHKEGVRWLLMRKFAKDLAYVRRYHKIPADFETAALFFGGREAVERAIEEALARDVFERNIRTEAEYKAYEAEVGRTLFEKGHALTQTVVKIVELHAKLRAELARRAAAGRAGGPGPKSLGLYELSRLRRVKPEYLDAVTDLEASFRRTFWPPTPSSGSSASRAISRA